MKEKNATVLVLANFAVGDDLFTWLKKYAQHSDDRFLYWNDFAFTTQPLAETDAVLVLNQPAAATSVTCDPGKLIAFMMEPGVPALHPWMFKGMDVYAQVFSPLGKNGHSIPSHGYQGWWVGMDWQHLTELKLPVKSKQMSCISSGLTQLEGHRKRVRFVNALRTQFPQIDYWGRDSHYIKDKMDGLLSYRYSIAIENTSRPYYFTEKITDCFLAYTIPVYYGCTNIGKYFPARSFIQIDINDPSRAMKSILQILEEDDWSGRIDALREARELVLNRYQPLAGAAEILRAAPANARKQITLVPVQVNLSQRMAQVLRRWKHRIALRA